MTTTPQTAGTHKYPIKEDTILRDVYLMWLIANDPKEFLAEHDLAPRQVAAMREYTQNTWKEFELARGRSRGSSLNE